MAQRGPIHLARIAGIDLLLHWTWFLVLLYEVESRAGAYTWLGWNVLEVLALFAIVTLHEFGHALACRQVGGTANRILLWPFGGIAFVDPPPRPGATLWTIAAGPLVNVALAPLLWWAQGLAASGNAATFLQSIFAIDLGLLVFNLMPVYPLDGGQILQALLWFPLGRARSLLATTVLGLAGVALLLLEALRTQDLWLGMMTGFILLYCWNGLKRARAMGRLAKLPRHAGWACPDCQAAPPLAELWDCRTCHKSFDPFATGGACPLCAQQFQRARCLNCGHAHPLAAWAASGAGVAAAG
ncbi:MAG TPA: site-2 protease family protein [Terriglobales bacterium]|nr:site-2 protease family protein [Terriglobales bacterium]